MYQVYDRRSNREPDSWSDSKSGVSSNSSQSNDHQDDPTNLIVNYLPTHFREDNLRELFEEFGTIESLIVMYSKNDYRKKSKGYGFVKFANAEQAAAAIEGVDGKKISNKTIRVSIARPGRQRQSANVFVSRLPVHWTTEDLKDAFKEFGHIVESRVLTFRDGVSRRCGFVRYDQDAQAKAAMAKMRNFQPSPTEPPLQLNLSVNHNADARQIVDDRAPQFDLRNDRVPSWMSRADYISDLRRDGEYRSPFAHPDEIENEMLHRAFRDIDLGGVMHSRDYRDPAYMRDLPPYRGQYGDYGQRLSAQHDTYTFSSPEPVSLLRHNAPSFQPGKSTQEPPAQKASPPQQSFSGGGSLADELQKLSELRTHGILSDDEFAQAKQKLLA